MGNALSNIASLAKEAISVGALGGLISLLPMGPAASGMGNTVIALLLDFVKALPHLSAHCIIVPCVSKFGSIGIYPIDPDFYIPIDPNFETQGTIMDGADECVAALKKSKRTAIIVSLMPNAAALGVFLIIRV